MKRLRQKSPKFFYWWLLILTMLTGLLPMPVAAAGVADCNVAIYGSPDVQSWLTDVQSKVAGTSLFHQVDAFYVGSGAQIPTLATLQTYKSVLVFSDKPFNNKVTMGNVLADYVDGGGGVVVAAFAFYGPSHPSGLAGRIASGNYLPFASGIQASQTPLTLVPDLPTHAILTKVASFHGGSASYYNKVTLASGATQVAHWSNSLSTPLVATKQITAGMVVGLNLYPPSSDARSDFWQTSTNGARLIANALRFAGCPNTDPIAQNGSVSINEDTAGAVTLQAADPDGDTLVYTLVTSPTHGTLSGIAPNLTYTPAANYNGADSFTFKVNDGWVDSNVATITLTVNPVNDAPSFVSGGNVSISEDAGTFDIPWANNLSNGPSDEAGQSAVMQVTNDNPALFAEQPTIHPDSGHLRFTPATNAHGQATVRVKRVDNGGIDNGGADSSSEVSFMITVMSDNDAPVADAQSVTLAEDVVTEISLTGSDMDGDGLTYHIVAPPQHGTLNGTGPALMFTPNANFNGNDSFSFTVRDGISESLAAVVDLTVTPVNDAPATDRQTVTTAEDAAKAITLSATDIEGDALSFAVVGQPANGVLSGDVPNLLYTPNPNFTGTDSFRFTASDGQAASEETVTILVSSVNDAPTADRQTVTTDEDVAKAITLSATDGEGDALTFAISSQPTNGVLSGNAPDLVYTPNPDFNGSDSFRFTADDGQASSEEVVTILVNSVNDAPDTVLLGQPADPSGNSVSFSFAGSDVDGSVDHFVCALDGASFAVCTTPQQYTGLAAGAHTFQVMAIDNQGLADPTAASASWHVQNEQTGQAQITIVLDMQPDRGTNIRFKGDLGSFYLDDTTNEDDDDDYTNTRTFTVEPGVYKVYQPIKKDWVTTGINCTPTAALTDLTQQSATITANSGDAITCTFVTQRGVTIEARAYEDRGKHNEHDGRKNKGDRYLKGWEMTIYSSPTTVITSGLTSGKKNPMIVFERLHPGSYVVCETLQAGWSVSDPAPTAILPGYEGKVCKAVTLLPGKTARLLFGQYQTVASDREEDEEEGEEGEIDAAEVDQIFDSPLTENDSDADEQHSWVFLPVIVR